MSSKKPRLWLSVGAKIRPYLNSISRVICCVKPKLIVLSKVFWIALISKKL